MAKATRQQSKQHNTHLILRTIYQQKAVSRAELARLTDLTRPTVSNIVLNLIERNLVFESGIGASTGGKRPIIVQIANDAFHMLCMDISGRYFRGALINLRGEIVHEIKSSAKNSRGDEAIAVMFEMIDQLLAYSNTPIVGIGIGTPGLFNPSTGVVRRAVNLDWADIPLQQLLAERYTKHPIYIANDSQVAAMAELSFTEDLLSRNLVLLKMGRGIGAGILMNGEILYGDGFGTGEIGHVVISEENSQLLTLETVASSQVVLDTIRGIVGREVTWDEIDDEILENETITNIVEQIGHYLGIVIANLIAIVNIHHIVISGQLARFGDMLLHAAKQAALKYGLTDTVEATKIRYSELGTEIVLLGCSALILKQELGML